MLLKPNVAAAIVLTPKPRATTLTVTPATGFFSGLFSCTDANPLVPTVNVPRANNAYSGLIVRDVGGRVGHGLFVLPNLPRVAGETTLNTKIVSGAVTLTP